MQKLILSFIALSVAATSTFAQQTAFVGTPAFGGTGNNGTLFITTAGATGINDTVSLAGGTLGTMPECGVVLAPNGRFYGTMSTGCANNHGGVYEIKQDGTFTIVYSFTAGNDGAQPQAALYLANDGNLYGTTYQGGPSGYGVIFRYVPGSSTVTPIYNFTGGSNVFNVIAPLVQGSNGLLYGTGASGGANGYGAI